MLGLCVCGTEQFPGIVVPAEALVLTRGPHCSMEDRDHSGIISDVQKSQELGDMVSQDHHAQKILWHALFCALWLWVSVNDWGWRE